MTEAIGLEAILRDDNFQRGLRNYLTGLDRMERRSARAARSNSAAFRNMGRDFDNIGRGVISMAGNITRTVATAVAGAAVGIGGVIASSVQAASSMEAQVSTIASVWNTTADAIAPVKDLIVDLGVDPRLKVSATEAGQAIELLARNGLSMTEILDGAAFSTVLLANATGTEFGNAADIATDAMSIFGHEASELAELIDGMVAVTTNSKFTIDDYNLALRNGGAAAAEAGIPLNEFNASIALMAEEAGTGMRAGTALRNFLMRLTPNTNIAADAMAELGLIVNGNNQFYDEATGELKSMADIAQILNEAMYGTSEVMVEVGGRTAEQNAQLSRLRDAYANAQQSITDYNMGIKGVNLSEEARAKKVAELQTIMANASSGIAELEGIQGDMVATTRQLTDEQRQTYMEMIFGQDALAATIALSNEGAEGINAMMGAMGETSAVEAAETRMNNFAGAIEILKGLIETIRIQVGDLFLPMLTNLVRGINEFVSQNQERLVSFFATISDAIQTMLDVADRGATPMQTLAAGLLALNVPETTVTQIVAIALGIRDLVAAIIEFVSNHQQELINAFLAIGAVLGTVAIAGVIVTIAGALAFLLNPIVLIAGAIAALAVAWVQDWGNIQATTATAVAAVVGFFQPMVDWFMGVWPAITAAFQAVWQLLVAEFSARAAAIATSVDVLKRQLGLAFGNIGVLIQSLKELWQSLQPAIQVVATAVGAIFVVLRGVITGVLSGILNAAGFFIDGLVMAISGIVQVITGIVNIVTGLVTGLVGMVTNNWDLMDQGVRQIGEGFLQAVGGIFLTLFGLIKGVIGSILAAIVGFVRGVITYFRELYNELVGNSIIPDMVDDILAYIEDLVFDFLFLIGGLMDSVIEAFVTGVSRIVQLAGDFKQAGVDLMLGIIAGIQSKVGDIISTVSGAIAGAIEAAKEAAGIASPSTEMLFIANNLADTLINQIRSRTSEVHEAFSEMMNIAQVFSGLGTSAARRLNDTILKPLADQIERQTDRVDGRREKVISDLVKAYGREVLRIDVDSEIVERGLTAEEQENFDRLVAMREDSQERLAAAQSGATGLSEADQRELDRLASLYNRANQNIRDYTSGVKGYGETQEEINAKIAEEQALIAALQPQIQALEDAKASQAAADIRHHSAILRALAPQIAELERLAGLTNEVFDLESIDFDDVDHQDLLNAYMRLIKLRDESEGGAANAAQRQIDAIQNLFEENNQLSRLKAEQIRQEERLLALQKAQADLEFLKQQQQLLKLIADNDLDGEDIMQGLKLGIDADAGDVLQAMTRAIQAVITQAEDELGIASPSTVFKKMGRFSIRGYEDGALDQIASARRSIAEALARGFFEPAAMAMQLNGGSSTTNIYNYSNRVTNNRAYNLSTNTRRSDATLATQFKQMQRLGA